MRVLHFSDIHVGIGLGQVPLAKWLSKRAIGGANLLLGRGRYFADARRKVDALATFRREQEIDLVIFSGDYTAMGLEREFRDARSAVDPLMDAPGGFVNVPGNHDLYVKAVVRDRRFDHHFGDTMKTDLPEYRVDGCWPVVRLVGEEVAVVAVNSARPNPPWRSSGLVPAEQLVALRDALGDARVRDRCVFVVTHYAPRLADGTPDRRIHGLVNADDFLAACAGASRGAILCGHVHHGYRVRVPEVRLPIFCGGSATMDGREGLWVFDADVPKLSATRGYWDGEAYRLDRDSTSDL